MYGTDAHILAASVSEPGPGREVRLADARGEEADGRSYARANLNGIGTETPGVRYVGVPTG